MYVIYKYRAIPPELQLGRKGLLGLNWNCIFVVPVTIIDLVNIFLLRGTLNATGILRLCVHTLFDPFIVIIIPINLSIKITLITFNIWLR